MIVDRALRQADIDVTGEVEVTAEDHAIVIRPHRYSSDDEARAAGDAIRRVGAL